MRRRSVWINDGLIGVLIDDGPIDSDMPREGSYEWCAHLSSPLAETDELIKKLKDSACTRARYMPSSCGRGWP
jgi:hypothetical protein